VKGKTVGVQRATIHDSYLTDNYGKDVKIKRYGTQDEAYLDIVAGRLDLLLADSVALDDGFLKKPEGKDYEFVGPDLTDVRWFGEGAGIACRKKDTDLMEMFNKAIDKIRADGTYKRMAHTRKFRTNTSISTYTAISPPGKPGTFTGSKVEP